MKFQNDISFRNYVTFAKFKGPNLKKAIVKK